jgi:hypothetical protein
MLGASSPEPIARGPAWGGPALGLNAEIQTAGRGGPLNRGELSLRPCGDEPSSR